MINMGIILGSGIFLVPSSVASLLDSSFLNLAAWVVAGLFSILGALTIGELAAAFPCAGGMFVYLKEAFGPLWGFLYGWALFVVIQTGSIAAVAVAFASYFGHFVDLSATGLKLAAVLTILFLSLVNYLGVRLGAWTQNVVTVAKVGALLLLVFYGLAAGVGKSSNFQPLLPSEISTSLAGSFGLALIGALWCYDGWIQTCYVGAEVRAPGKNLPLSMILSALLILAIYLLVNVAYIYVLSTHRMAQSSLVAADLAGTFLGPAGAGFISLLVMVATFGSTNGMILAGARVYYAMAREKLFFRRAGSIHSRFLTPDAALLFQALWSSVLVFSGSYEQLFTYVIFVEFLFYGMTAAGVFILRRRSPDLHRPYRAWGYPVVPAAFVIFSALLLLNAVWTNPADTGVGTLLLLSGLPAYAFWRKRRMRGSRP